MNVNCVKLHFVSCMSFCQKYMLLSLSFSFGSWVFYFLVDVQSMFSAIYVMKLVMVSKMHSSYMIY